MKIMKVKSLIHTLMTTAVMEIGQNHGKVMETTGLELEGDMEEVNMATLKRLLWTFHHVSERICIPPNISSFTPLT